MGRIVRFLPGLLILLLSGGAQAEVGEEVDREYWSARAQLDRTYRTRLADLAARCRELGLVAESELTAAWFVPRDPARQLVFLPPGDDPLQPAEDASRLVRQWHARLMLYRRRQAEQLYRAADQQRERGRATRAFQLLHEVLREDPDHAAARAALGYRQVRDRWTRPAAGIRARQVRPGAAPRHLPPGISWLVESENFSIATSHSRQAGEELAERLEQLYAVWQQLFVRYWSSTAALERRFEGQAPPGRSRDRHQVVLFRDRQEYLDYLQPHEPLIEMTVGYYHEGGQTAYFYDEDGADWSVVYHEVTHQLFSETGRVAPETGRDENFWIVEGVALYMESLREFDGYWTVGGVDARRLQYARYRVFREDFYVPLEQLVQFGRRDLQEHPEIRPLYSQSAGLTAMLMDHRGGESLEALVDYLRSVYSGRHDAGTLASVTERSLAEWDAEYRLFLQVSDQDLAPLAAMPVARQLALGHTRVTDQGLEHLAGHTQLEWLDLGATQISDTGLAFLRNARRLNQLNLAGTQITDDSLPRIGEFTDLEILDLSGTQITDAGLAHLGRLSELLELSLRGTRISDAGLEHLRGLENLEILDINDTRVTSEGWQRARSAWPALQH